MIISRVGIYLMGWQNNFQRFPSMGWSFHMVWHNNFQGFPLWGCIWHMMWRIFFQWVYTWGHRCQIERQIFYKGLPVWAISASWSDTYFATVYPCRHIFLHGFTPWGCSFHMVWNTFPRDSPADTYFERVSPWYCIFHNDCHRFCKDSPCRHKIIQMVLSWVHSCYMKWKIVLEGVIPWGHSCHMGWHSFC